MVKHLKLGIVFFLIALVISGATYGIYFASQLSATYPPIKKYDFSVNTKTLEKSIIDLVESTPMIEFQKTDTVGSIENGFAYYMKINFIQKDIEYLIKYKETNVDYEGSQHSELRLIHAFDRKNNILCYKIEDDGMKVLLERFESEIISKTMIRTRP